MKPTRFELIVLLITAGIISYYIFVPPIIGLADNGDYERVLGWRGLSHVSDVYSEKYFRYANSKYLMVPPVPGRDWYLTSTSLLIIPAVRFARLFGENRVFDIRIFAAIQLVLYLLGIWLILVGTRSLTLGTRLLLAALLILIMTDVGYIAYFNSFYAEGTALAFLAIAIGCALILMTWQSANAWLLVLYFFAVTMLITSKPMYVPLAPAFGLFGMYLCRRLRFWKKYWVAAAIMIATSVLGLWYLRETTSTYGDQSAYVGLFMDLLPHSSTQRQDLAELGLNPDYSVFSGTSPYQADSPLRTDPVFISEFRHNIKSSTIPLFYLRRPERFFSFCRRCARRAFVARVDNYGYYEASAGKPLFKKPFGLWSSIRERMFPRSIWFIAPYFLSGLVALGFIRRSGSASFLLLYSLLVLITAAQFFIATLGGGGEPDLIKHLFMFNVAFDLSFACIVLGAYRLLRTRNRFRWKRLSRVAA